MKLYVILFLSFLGYSSPFSQIIYEQVPRGSADNYTVELDNLLSSSDDTKAILIVLRRHPSYLSQSDSLFKATTNAFYSALAPTIDPTKVVVYVYDFTGEARATNKIFNTRNKDYDIDSSLKNSEFYLVTKNSVLKDNLIRNKGPLNIENYSSNLTKSLLKFHWFKYEKNLNYRLINNEMSSGKIHNEDTFLKELNVVINYLSNYDYVFGDNTVIEDHLKIQVNSYTSLPFFVNVTGLNFSNNSTLISDGFKSISIEGVLNSGDQMLENLRIGVGFSTGRFSVSSQFENTEYDTSLPEVLADQEGNKRISIQNVEELLSVDNAQKVFLSSSYYICELGDNNGIELEARLNLDFWLPSELSSELINGEFSYYAELNNFGSELHDISELGLQDGVSFIEYEKQTGTFYGYGVTSGLFLSKTSEIFKSYIGLTYSYNSLLSNYNASESPSTSIGEYNSSWSDKGIRVSQLEIGLGISLLINRK